MTWEVPSRAAKRGGQYGLRVDVAHPFDPPWKAKIALGSFWAVGGLEQLAVTYWARAEPGSGQLPSPHTDVTDIDEGYQWLGDPSTTSTRQIGCTREEFETTMLMSLAEVRATLDSPGNEPEAEAEGTVFIMCDQSLEVNYDDPTSARPWNSPSNRCETTRTSRRSEGGRTVMPLPQWISSW